MLKNNRINLNGIKVGIRWQNWNSQTLRIFDKLKIQTKSKGRQFFNKKKTNSIKGEQHKHTRLKTDDLSRS